MQNTNDLENFITGESLSLATIADKFVARGSLKLSSSDDAVLERKLRELKAKQELRKDWILFIVRDVVIFPTTILFILVVCGYSLFTLIQR